MTLRLIFLTPLTLLAAFNVSLAQNRIGTGKAQELYQNYCANCHGKELEGGLGGPLVGDNWDYVKDFDDMAEYITNGNAKMGMPPFGGALTPEEIRSLVIFVKEKNAELEIAEHKAIADKQAKSGVFEGGGETFKVEDVVTGLDRPWSIAFLPDGRYLITEKGGALRIAEADGTLLPAIEGTPAVRDKGQGGLLEVALHPDYKSNGWIYLSFSQPGPADKSMTKIVRGKIEDGKWTDDEVIFEVEPKYMLGTSHHFGNRIVFKDGYLYFSIGDRGRQDMAQDVSKPNGKIHRIHDDGRVPKDNPFADNPDAYPTIWTYGNRNPQGLDMHPVTGDIWEAEHGPRGGDEVNLIRPGINYGWPVITYGMNYNGTPITDKTAAPGMEQPEHYWVPSIAVCGIDFYEGDLFPNWKNNLMVGGLASNELHLIVISEDNKIVKDEIVLKGIGRVRDVASAPDGSLMLVLNGPDKVVRLVPAD